MAEIVVGLLGTAFLTGKATTLVSTLGCDLIISTITRSTKGICSVLTYFATSNHSGIKEIINQLDQTDLEFYISIIEQVVNEQEGKELPVSVKKALIGVNDILTLIHKELDEIKKSLEYHETKYFNTWRSFSLQYNIETIKKHNDLLKNRYSVLIELLKIYNFTPQQSHQYETNINH